MKRIKDLQKERLLRRYPELRELQKEISRDVRGLSKVGARAKQQLQKQISHDVRGLSKVGARAKQQLQKQLRTGAAASTPWVDPDDAPELTEDYFQRADLYHGNKLIRRGRPPSENPKRPIKLRLDADVVEHFRATGPGWQTRINDTLRRAAKLKRSA